MLDLDRFKKEGEYLLIHTDDWFYTKDGNQYHAVWGKCKPVEAKDLFGFKPSGDTNWYLQVGENENAMFVAGCRIHYAQICPDRPFTTANGILCLN